ncbi:MAG: hypothetical protein NT154_05855 [Verrucomicrobia bacterium]|nr:hypothetical protein [Verrucomicrobiota bacterium]
MALTPGDILHYTRGASRMDEDEAIRKALEFWTTVRCQCQSVVWSCLPSEARFWDWKSGPAKAHYL